MRFAFHASMPAPDHYLPLARAAEELGFDSFTFPDSICYPKESNAKYPYNDDGSRDFLDGVPFLEVFIAMAACAAFSASRVSSLPLRLRRSWSGPVTSSTSMSCAWRYRSRPAP